MKKRLLILFAVCALAFAACSRNNADENSVTDDNDTTIENDADEGLLEDDDYEDGDEAASDTIVGESGDAVRDAADGVGDAVEDIGEGADNVMDDVGEGIENTVE